MNKKRIISPSLLSADFTKLQHDIQIVENLGVNRLHLDVMDGHFVPNITFGPFIIKDIRKITNAHLETHLMIDNPHKYLDQFIDSGSDTIIIHQEASKQIKKDLIYIKEKNVKAGIAINPNTNYNKIIKYLDFLDYILIMSVYPGFGGQSFINDTLNKMEDIVSMASNYDILIGVDGGVNINTIDKIYNTGIDIVIVGSGLYGAKDIKSRYKKLINDV